MNELAPFRLRPTFAPRTWGRPDLSAWYAASVLPEIEAGSDPIGEAWLTGPACVVAEGPNAGETLAEVAEANAEALLGSGSPENEFPLLMKLLFPNAKLSVQVHPNDEEARKSGLGRGKTECWYVLEAEPGATVACGLAPGATVAQMSEAIADGTMEDLLNHLPVKKGDMVFVDAGTVHAIGPGATLLEIQQTSDTTYRLYDYGRPRELHLQAGLAVSKQNTRAGKVAPLPIPNGTRLLQEQYFTVDSFSMKAGDALTLDDAAGKPHCFTALYGDAEVVTGDTRTQLPANHSVVVPATCGTIVLKASADVEVVRSMP
jgi:mannose-6-phosphate isomerase